MSTTNTTCNVTCPSCGAKNRMPLDRLKDNPKCGKCKKPVFNGKPIEINAANVAATLNHNDLPVLVDCWAPWCGPCKSFAPIFEKATQQLQHSVRFAKLNTEQHQQVASRWQIRSIPTLILFKQGKEAARISGALPLPQLKQWLKQNGI